MKPHQTPAKRGTKPRRGSFGGMSMTLSRLLLGPPVANAQAEGDKLGVISGVPAMGLDGLGSAAYGPEAALAVLGIAGAAGLGVLGPITWVTLLLLAILWSSYWQTIRAYPNNGGSYIVARENLGVGAGLLAAAALMVDYMLNVSVGISAGVGALTSAIPALAPYTLWLCLGILAAITVVNLRGTGESGLVFALPTYVFIASLGGVLVWGLLSGGAPVVKPPALPEAHQALGIWLILRAFASGCTAMTGVEAVSNGVGAFKQPRVKRAHGTLSVISGVLGLLLAGIALLAHRYDIMAMDQSQPGYQSVLSQLVGAVAGRGYVYDITIGSVLAVLCLSANTSFVGFPRLCRMVAADGFLPAAFAVPGRRLVYSVGVLFLAVCSGGLLLLFGGITDRLIPLFAVGAFLSFSLSQAGMAAHWRREGALGKLAINGTGAIATTVALAIILVAKFTEGAWLTVLVIPATLLLLRTIHNYYERIQRQVAAGGGVIDLAAEAAPVALVPIKRWDGLARKAVEHAMRLAPEVVALHVDALEGPDAEEHERGLRTTWTRCVEVAARNAGRQVPELRLVPSPYRSVVSPLLKEIERLRAGNENRPVLVVLPELVEFGWLNLVMHVHRERKLRQGLLRYGGRNVAIVSVPWQIEQATPAEGVAAEEGQTS